MLFLLKVDYTGGSLDSCGYDPVLNDIFKFRSAVFKTDLNQVLERAVLRCEFVVTAYFAVFKYAYMVLIVETNGPSEAYDLVGVLPGDEVISETLFDKE